MQQRRANDSSSIKSFLNNAESTMSQALSASVASALLRLSKIYLKVDTDDNQQIENYLAALSVCVKNQSDASLDSAWQFIKTIIEENSDELDHVTIWQNGKSDKYLIPLKMTLALVYAALTDNSRFSDHAQDYSTDLADEENEAIKQKRIAQDQADRLSSLWCCFKELQSKPRCHQGVRHELAFTLNGVYPGIWFVEDFELFLHDVMMDHFNEKLECIRRNDPHAYLQILFFEISDQGRYPEFKKLLDNSREELSFLIEKNCHENGINPMSYEKTINSYVNSMDSIELPMGSNRIVHCIKSLLMTRTEKNNPDDRDKALLLAKTWIHQHFQINSSEHIKSLQAFSAIDSAYQLFKKYQHILRVWNHDIIKPENIDELKTLFINYYSASIMQQSPCIISDESSKLLEQFQNASFIYQKDARVDWIENFFARWDAVKDNKTARQQLYAQLSDPLTMEKYIISDEFLRTVFPEGAEVVEMTPYIINRIFLHAITITPELCTPLFIKYFSDVYEFVLQGFKDEDNRYQADNLLNSSYPVDMMQQLNYLKDYYHYLSMKGNEACDEPAPVKYDYIPMRNLIKTFNHFSAMITMIPESRRADFLKTLGREALQSIIHNGYELPSLLACFPGADRTTILKDMGSEALQSIIKHTDQLISVLSYFSEADRINVLNHIGSDGLIFIIKNKNGLASVLRCFPEANRISILKELGNEALQSIIKNGDELVSVLSYFLETDRISILKYLGIEALQSIIMNGDELAVVLEVFPEVDKISILKELGSEALQSIIKDGVGLLSMLRHFFKADRINVFKHIGSDTLRSIIKNGHELKDVLECFPEADRINVLNHIGSDALRFIIKNKNELVSVVTCFSAADRISILKDLGSEKLQSIIKNGYQLASVLGRFREADQITVLKDMGSEALQSIIKNGDELAVVLKFLPEVDQPSLHELLRSKVPETILEDGGCPYRFFKAPTNESIKLESNSQNTFTS